MLRTLSLSSFTATVFFIAAGLSFSAGCESEHAPVYHSGSAGSPSTDDDAEFSCERPVPSVCGTETVQLPIDKPAVHFLLDYSGSMAGPPRDTVIDSLEVVLRNTGHRIRYGLSIFPYGSADSQEVLETVDVGEDYVGPFECGRPNGPVLNELLDVLRHLEPDGDTPLGGALSDLRTRIETVEGKRVVVVMTDGDPTEDGICGGTPCSAHEYALDGAAKLLALGIPSYVVGVGGFASGYLTRLAQAGGTAATSPSPGYYRATSADELSAVLSAIGNAVRGCSIELEQAPDDLSLVNVFLDGDVVPRGGDDGWSMETSKTIVLSGASCTRVLEGKADELTVHQGCPTIIK